MGLALNRLAAEDPSFRVKTDEESGQTIIAGMGELHLDIHRRPHASRVQGRGQRRRAAGCLPRNHHASRTKKTTRTRSSPVVPASSRASRSSSNRTRMARTSSSNPRSSAVRFRRNTSPASRRASKAFCLRVRWLASRCSASRRR